MRNRRKLPSLATTFSRRLASHKWFLLIAFVVLFGCAGSYLLSLSFASSPSAPGSGNLHVSGNQIIDAAGNVIVLRGAMLESAFAYTNDFANQAKDPTTILNPTTFGAMASWHMNAIRINISQWEYNNPAYEPRYQNDLTQVVNQATSAGLYVVLDYHEDGQSGSPTDPDCLNKNSKPNVALVGAMLQQTDLNWWVTIATQFKNNPKVLYDVINEPKYGGWSNWYNGNPNYTYTTDPANCTTTTGTYTASFNVKGIKDVISAIRSTGSQQIIVLEPGDAASGDNPQDTGWQCFYGTSCTFATNPITDTNIVYSKHSYASVVKPALTSSNPVSIWSKDWGPFWNNGPTVPVYYGEWAALPNPAYPSFCTGNGYTMTNANADGIVNSFLTYMNQFGISWTGWAFTPTHIIQNFSTYAPTNFTAQQPSVGAAWSCGDSAAQANSATLGMGQDVQDFLWFIRGDCNADHKVSVTDLSIMLSHFNKTYAGCDLNSDGTVTVQDLSTLLSNFGT